MTWRAGRWLGFALLALACASGRQRVPQPATNPAGSPHPAAGAEAPGATPPVSAEPKLVEVPVEPLPERVEDLLAEEDAEAVDPAEILAQSMSAYEEAHDLWQEGRLSEALEALDSAYALMSEAPPNGDPRLAQEKEDLRRLIARRIVEVYASRRAAVGDMSAAIPRIVNADVEREIRSFQNGERAYFLEAHRRSGLYRPMIVEELRKAGLPEQLSWLPMVESWFKERALSTARAVGMWQFIASTGYRFGLRRGTYFDERMDPVKSTRAAIAYLTELHEMFGDWLTALAAYNCGEARVLRTIERQRAGYFDQFWDLYAQLPQETRRYVPRFLAALAILEDPARYGFHDLPDPLPAPATTTLPVARAVRLDELERRLALAPGTLVALNPELHRGTTPDESYELRVPVGTAVEAVVAALEGLPRSAPPAAETTVHRVRSGETLSLIAKRYGTSVSSLMRLNGLSNPHRLRVGQELRVAGSTTRPAVAAAANPVTHTVRRGDSLWKIAERYGTSVERLKEDNHLRSNVLRPGQRLLVHPGA